MVKFIIDPNTKELDIQAMVRGIGRKASDEELIDYLVKDIKEVPVDLELAFYKYENQ